MPEPEKEPQQSWSCDAECVCVHNRTPQQAAAGHAKFDAAEIRDKL